MERASPPRCGEAILRELELQKRAVIQQNMGFSARERQEATKIKKELKRESELHKKTEAIERARLVAELGREKKATKVLSDSLRQHEAKIRTTKLKNSIDTWAQEELKESEKKIACVKTILGKKNENKSYHNQVMHKNISTNKDKTKIDNMMTKRMLHQNYIDQQHRIKEMKELVAKKRGAQQEATRVQKIAEDRLKEDIETSSHKLSKQLYQKQLLKEKSEREATEKEAASWAKSALGPRPQLTHATADSRRLVHSPISKDRYKSLSTDRYAETAEMIMLTGMMDTQPIKPFLKTKWK